MERGRRRRRCAGRPAAALWGRLGAASLLLAALAGCERRATGEDGREVATTDSAGVELVENSGPARQTWRLEPLLRLGEIDGPLSFGQVRWVAPAPRGEVLVLDGQSRKVHVFGPDGRHLREFGGKGGGPGEFQRPAAVTAVRGGRFAVTEGLPPAIHWFDSTGTYLETFRPRAARSQGKTPTAGTLAAWQVTRSGIAFSQVMTFEPPQPGQTELPVKLVRYPRDGGGPPDTFAEWTWEPGLGDQQIRVFRANVTWSPLDDGSVVLAPGSPYEILHYGAGGSLDRIVRRTVEPVPVTEANREAERREMKEGLAAFGAPDAQIDQMIDRLRFEDRVPEILRVWASEPDGRTWAGVYDPEIAAKRSDGDAVRVNAWDVFSADGRLETRVEAPAGFQLYVVTEEVLYGMWQDELEIPFARTYRIERSGGGRPRS